MGGRDAGGGQAGGLDANDPTALSATVHSRWAVAITDPGRGQRLRAAPTLPSESQLSGPHGRPKVLRLHRIDTLTDAYRCEFEYSLKVDALPIADATLLANAQRTRPIREAASVSRRHLRHASHRR